MASPQSKDQNTNEVFEQTSFLYGANALFIEAQLERFLADPESVDESWRNFFASISKADLSVHRPSWARVDWPESNDDITRALTGSLPPLAALAKSSKAVSQNESSVKELQQKVAAFAPTLSTDEIRRAVTDTVRAIQMIRAYRSEERRVGKECA